MDVMNSNANNAGELAACIMTGSGFMSQLREDAVVDLVHGVATKVSYAPAEAD